MFFNKKAITVIALMFCVCILGFLVPINADFLSVNTAHSHTFQKIILDAGHGGLTNTID